MSCFRGTYKPFQVLAGYLSSICPIDIIITGVRLWYDNGDDVLYDNGDFVEF